jgi:PAS domain S-box-containing protein
LRLTVYFAMLVGLVAVAAAAAAVYVFVQTDRDSRRTAEQDAAFAADTAARELGSNVGILRATVTGLAATPNVDVQAVQPTCQLTFGLSDVSRGHVDVLRPDGSVACSSRPRTGSKALAGYVGASWLGRVRGGPVLLAPVRDTATGDPSVLVAAPIAGNRGFVAAFVALAPIGESFVKVYGGGHPVEFLVTSPDEKTVLSRSIGPERAVGAPLAGTAFARAGDAVERRDLDGTPRLYAGAVVPGAGWHFFAGEDKAAALAAGHQLRNRQLVIILAGLALVMLATFAVYRRVAVPIRRLGASVRSSAALTPPEPVPVAGTTEVIELGDDINGLISSVGRELEQRREAEAAARTSEESYRLLFESNPLPMWIHDAGTRAILAVNDAAVGRYSWSREEFLGLTVDDVAPAGAGSDGGELSAGTRHMDKDGAEIKVRAIEHGVVFDGRPAVCVVAEDVGERERLETQLRQAQKMEAVGQLAGGIAHDFNNLLTVISGYGAMARQRIGAGPGAQELTEIDHAAERAAQLTRQLLVFSRQQLIEPSLLELGEVVGAVTPMLSRLIGEDVEIGVLVGDDVPRVLADRGQIEQLIVNLAVNARDAMPDGGTLTIETREELLDERYAASRAGVQPGIHACVEVTDTGIGMDRETQARIFEPFFTTKDVGRGTGLGLATVHGIVKHWGGHVAVYSEPGLGTTFKVYLPAAAGELETRAPAPPKHAGRLTGTETILVCEDDDLVRKLLEAIFTEHGYTVLIADQPSAALEIAASYSGPIEVLVTDVVMPLMSGPELVERLESVRPGLGVVLLSGYTADAVRRRGLPPGSRFLQKPFDDVSLLETVRSLLEGGAGPAAEHVRARLDDSGQ